MQRRQITLEDGRYLIFYTFDEDEAAAVEATTSSDEKTAGTETSRAPEPSAEPQATEERRV